MQFKHRRLHSFEGHQFLPPPHRRRPKGGEKNPLMATSTTTHARTQAAAPEKRSHGREEAKAEAEASNTNFRPKEEGEGDSTGEKISARSRRGIIMAKRRLLPSLPSGPSRKKKNGSVPFPPFYLRRSRQIRERKVLFFLLDLLLFLLGDFGGLFSYIPCTLKKGASREKCSSKGVYPEKTFLQKGCSQRNSFFKKGAFRKIFSLKGVNFSSKWVHQDKTLAFLWM